ncbi:MAG TPA: DNA polymerase III subunit delta' [Pseudomonadales bacterium]|nr:DNA polymerase III subunit delta' [Pseudomonadales bacterium]
MSVPREAGQDPLAPPLPWQRPQWQRLVELQQQQKLAHALLLSGPQGIGKRCFAERLATWLLCHQPGREQACGACRSCGWIRAGTHPDLFWLLPESPARVIKIDQVREANEFMQLSAQAGHGKVVIIDPADQLNRNAANALLKSLEEPAAERWLLLVSSRYGMLLPTIVSRCQRLTMVEPTAPQAQAWLRDHTDAELPWDEILAASRNRPLRALDLAREPLWKQYNRALTLLSAISTGRSDPLLLAEGGEQFDPELLLDWWWGWLVAAIRLASGLAADLPLPTELTTRAGQASPLALFDFLNRLEQARTIQGQQITLNRSLLLGDLALRWRDAFARRQPLQMG